MPLVRNRPRFDAAKAPAARARSITLHTLQRARRARRELLLIVPLTAATIVAYIFREEIFGVDTPVRVAAAGVLVVLGWALARDLGRWVEPELFRRVDPGTAGTVGFLIRLTFLVLAALTALRIAGLTPRTLAVGGAVTAVVFGLAAQQTLGNLIAGMVLISARPFRIGDRVRLQGGGLAGQVEGTVASLGLLYVTFSRARTRSWSPTTSCSPRRSSRCASPPRSTSAPACGPTSSPRGPGAAPARRPHPVRAEPHISLEEIDSEEVVVRIAATPESEEDGPRLADESSPPSLRSRARATPTSGWPRAGKTCPRAWRIARTRRRRGAHGAAVGATCAAP
jgi:hypothetical protein